MKPSDINMMNNEEVQALIEWCADTQEKHGRYWWGIVKAFLVGVLIGALVW
jgi:hypothetical protein